MTGRQIFIIAMTSLLVFLVMLIAPKINLGPTASEEFAAQAQQVEDRGWFMEDPASTPS